MRCNTRCWRMRLRLKSRRKSNAQCSKMRLEQARHSSTSHCHEYYIGIHILFRTGLVRKCQKEVILTYLPKFRYMYSIKKEVSKQFLTKITFWVFHWNLFEKHQIFFSKYWRLVCISNHHLQENTVQVEIWKHSVTISDEDCIRLHSLNFVEWSEKVLVSKMLNEESRNDINFTTSNNVFRVEQKYKNNQTLNLKLDTLIISN